MKMERECVIDSGEPKVGSWLVEADRIAVIGPAARDDADDGWSASRGEFEGQLGPRTFVFPEHERSGVEGRPEFGLDVRREDEVPVVKVRE